MTENINKKQQVYRMTLTGYGREAEECYAVNQSDNDRYIELEFFYPFNGLTAEIYKEDGFNLLEKTQAVYDLIIGLFYAFDFIYGYGNTIRFKESFDKASKEFVRKKSRREIEKLHRKRLAYWMLRHFKPEHISINLRRQIDQLLRKLLREGKFEYRSKYSASFVKNFLLFGKMEEIDLDGFAENMRYNVFLDLDEEVKMNLYIEMKSGKHTGYEEYLQEWWEELNENI